MGRTAPSSRVLVEAELKRLHRIAKRIRSKHDRELLEDLLSSVHKILEAYKYEAMTDPLEPILIGALLEIARRCEGLKKK